MTLARPADGSSQAAAAPPESLAEPTAESLPESLEPRPRRSNRSSRWLLGFALVFLVLLADASRPPSRQVSARVLLASIDVYQATLSPLMPTVGVRCRFEPSCSHYAEGAIRARGAWIGAGLTLWRVLRCGPWTKLGTVDPPPEAIAQPSQQPSA